MPTATATSVVLAAHIPGNTGPSVVVDDQRRAMVDGDAWTVLDRPEQIAAALASSRRRPSERRHVLAALQLAGYWPTDVAIRAYLKGLR